MYLPNSSGIYTSGPLHYEIDAHFTNAIGGLDEEFSYEEIGLLQINVVFFCLHFSLMFYATIVRNELVKVMRQHHTANLLFTVVCITPVKYCFTVGYWLSYSRKGRANKALWSAGLIVDAVCTTMIICLFALLGSGWSVFRRKLPVINRMRTGMMINQSTDSIHSNLVHFSFAFPSI